ncbi:MAG TPA: cation diffusion facilitator family transporter [Casimicrobiaceae bacterium]|nr:cation diffusion facilitator family transporter [Casimicrobiaceae bacterium]
MTTRHSDDAFQAHAAEAGRHAHPHVHAGDGSTVQALAWALVLTAAFALIEAIGGWFAGSLALLSDAGHMVTDAAALGLALFAQWVARRPPSARASYGYARAEVLAAFVNALALLLLVTFIAFEAVKRILVPEPVAGGTVMVIAAAGLCINLITAWILSRAAHSHGTQSVLLHVLSDALGSIAALVAGAVISTTGWMPIDPLLSLVTALLILRSTWRLLGQTTSVLMEGVPAHLDYDEIGHALLGIDGVSGVHDLHVWHMGAAEAALSAHVAIDSGSRWPAILDEARRMLDSRFDIGHVTLQPSWPVQPDLGDRRVIPIRSSVRGESARTTGDR